MTSARDMADAMLLNPSAEEIEAFVPGEIARLLATGDPVKAEVARLYREGYRGAFLRWGADLRAHSAEALRYCLAQQICELVLSQHADDAAARAALARLIEDLVVATVVASATVLEARRLRRGGDS